MAKLVLSLDGALLNQYFIDNTNICIGRDAENEIVINDPLLSRVHARIICVGDDHIVEDLQSSNGSLINGSPLLRHILQHRDVIELGTHHLCYLNSRTAAKVDFERTMLIQALPRDETAATEEAAILAVPTARSGKKILPEGSVKVVTGLNPHGAGESISLDRVVTTFGTPGEQLVVITRRPVGYFLSHVEGTKRPRVNQKTIGTEAHPLHNDDLIEAAGYKLEFKLDTLAESR